MKIIPTSQLSTIRYLFGIRDKKGRCIYLIASIPLIFLALACWEYNAFFVYIIPAGLCLLQFFYPNMILWLLFMVIFGSFTGMYLYLLITDIIKLIIGNTPSALLDFDDSVVFVIAVMLLTIITYALFKIRPKRFTSKE